MRTEQAGPASRSPSRTSEQGLLLPGRLRRVAACLGGQVGEPLVDRGVQRSGWYARQQRDALVDRARRPHVEVAGADGVDDLRRCWRRRRWPRSGSGTRRPPAPAPSRAPRSRRSPRRRPAGAGVRACRRQAAAASPWRPGPPSARSRPRQDVRPRSSRSRGPACDGREPPRARPSQSRECAADHHRLRRASARPARRRSGGECRQSPVRVRVSPSEAACSRSADLRGLARHPPARAPA